MKRAGQIRTIRCALLRGVLFLLLAVSWVLPLHAAEKVRIAVVISASIDPYKESLAGFYEELNSLGVNYETREFLAGGGNTVAGEISRYRPAVIHTIGSKATRLVKKDFPSTPIIFSMVLNPVASGFVESMRSPGRNISGASMDIPFGQQFKYMKRILPQTKTIGVIYSEAETGSVVAEAESVASQMGFKLLKAEVKSPADLYSALNALVGKVDFLWSVADGNVFTRETTKEILLTTLREGVPFMGLSPSFVRAGALAALESSPYEMGKEAARITKRVVNGSKPANIPVSMANNIRLYINSNTIDLIGINVPEDVYKSATVITP